jgi:hypothetical protein
MLSLCAVHFALFVSSISELCKHCLTSCGGSFWFSQASVSLLCVNWSSIFSMKIVCVFSSISEYAPQQICFLPPTVCFHCKQKEQDELKQPKQLLFCGRTSHWCKHEEQQQLEEGERQLDLWCLDFRT